MKCLIAGFLLVVSVCANAQVGNFRSIASGNWNTQATWERDADSNGSFEESPSLVIPTDASGSITIQAGTAVDISTSISANQIVVEGDGTLNIASGGTLTLVNSGGTDLDILSADFITTFSDGIVNVLIGGTLVNQSLTPISSTSSNLIFEGPADPAPDTGGGIYRHAINGGTIPTASWGRGTTVSVTGVTGGTPANLGQTFYHFEWNCAGQSTSVILNGALTTIDGDFSINNTNNQFLILGYTAANSGATDVAGDLNITGTSKLIVSSVGTYDFNVVGNVGISAVPINTNNFPLFGTATGSVTMDVTGSFTFNSGSARTLRFVAAGGSFTLTVTGVATVSNSNTIDLSAGAGTGRLVLQNDFVFTSGIITESSTSTTSRVEFADSGSQTLSGSGTFTQVVGVEVASTSILDIGTFVIGGSGSFTNNGRIIVRNSDANGAIQNNTTNGNIRVPIGNRVWASGSTIEYGTGAVAIGNGHPSSGLVNTIINAAGGITIASGASLNTNDLTLTVGNLSVANQSLTINGTLSAASNISIGASGSITLNGTSTFGAFPFSNGSTPSFSNFTLNNPNGVTFNNSVTISGVLTLTDGALAFPGRTLTLSGTFAPTGSGGIAPSSTSTLAITGNGAFGTLRVDGTNNNVGTFTFSRASSGTASLNSTLVVVNTFNLNTGAFTNTNGLQMANGSTLFRGANGSLLGSAPTDLPANQNYNIHYTGALTTGLEMPGTTDDPTKLGTLTINGAVVLDKNITVNGNVNIASSTLDANGFNITLASTNGTWAKTNGSFIGGSGTLRIAGNITVTYTATPPTWSNVTTLSGSTLTMPTAAFVTGNFQINAASTFNHNNGTITFNGSGNQSLAAAGKTLNNIGVNKSGGQLTFTSAVNMLGVLNIQSATVVQSNGNLTLISTSDGTSGNASIASLAGGGSVAGAVTVQRRMSAEGRRYRDISSPVQTATVAQVMSSGITVTGFSGSSFPCAGCSTNGPSMYYYTESTPGAIANGYTPITSASDPLTPGRGYNVLVRNEVGAATLALFGAINTGPFTFPGLLSYTNSGDPGDGWNFIGNPFPSTVDWDDGWSVQNVQGNMISVWDAGANQYRTWNGSGGSLGSGLIATGQGFWVQAANNTAPIISVSETSKVSNTGTFYRKKDKEVHLFELSIAGNETDDKTYIQLFDGSTTEFDAMDGTKLAFDGLSLSTVVGDRKVAINAMGEIPQEGTLQLDLSNTKAGEYVISAQFLGEFKGAKISLLDQYQNETYDLSGQPITIVITDEEGSKDPKRFVLIFGDHLVTGVEEKLAKLVSVYPNPFANEVTAVVKSSIEPSGRIVDNMGKSIGSFAWSNEENGQWRGTLNMSGNSAGIYFARISFDGKERVIKLVKR